MFSREMIKRYITLLFVLLMLSCKSKEEKMFFDFDNVEYYSLNKNKEEEINENNRKGIKDSVFENILYNEFPKEFSDEKFINIINSNGFSKYKFSRKDVEELNENIFIEKVFFNLFQGNYACAPVYRDILVFKKQNKISGIAKICLSCKQYYFIGSKKNLEIKNFGMNDEFISLEKIFNSYKSKK